MSRADFESHALDVVARRAQVQEPRDLLTANNDLREKQFRQFFVPRTHLRALVGPYNPNPARTDLLPWECPIFGGVRCDFATGDAARTSYPLVEHEDAGPKSLFVKQG